jgi:hypothetical protein
MRRKSSANKPIVLIFAMRGSPGGLGELRGTHGANEPKCLSHWPTEAMAVKRRGLKRSASDHRSKTDPQWNQGECFRRALQPASPRQPTVASGRGGSYPVNAALAYWYGSCYWRFPSSLIPPRMPTSRFSLYRALLTFRTEAEAKNFVVDLPSRNEIERAEQRTMGDRTKPDRKTRQHSRSAGGPRCFARSRNTRFSRGGSEGFRIPAGARPAQG